MTRDLKQVLEQLHQAGGGLSDGQLLAVGVHRRHPSSPAVTKTPPLENASDLTISVCPMSLTPWFGPSTGKDPDIPDEQPPPMPRVFHPGETPRHLHPQSGNRSRAALYLDRIP